LVWRSSNSETGTLQSSPSGPDKVPSDHDIKPCQGPPSDEDYGVNA
jgi:hypothetical protein